jgi:hypothetical protein
MAITNTELKTPLIKVKKNMTIYFKVKPNARKNEILRDSSGNITIRIKAPAQDGKANEAICKYLGEAFGVPKSHITILSGHTSPHKKVEIEIDESTGQDIIRNFITSP